MKNKKYDIVAIGECLLDVYSEIFDDINHITMIGNPGGAPVNVLAQAVKLGMKTAYITKLSEDPFGIFLKKQLDKVGIDTNAIIMTMAYPTTLAIVSLDSRKNRSFRFYREKTADVMLRKDEIDDDLLKDTQIFHFGSVSMTREPSRSTTFTAVSRAKGYGALISFDPNLRVPLWRNLSKAREYIIKGMLLADFVKVSDEELFFLTGNQNIEAGARELVERYMLKLLTVTLGPKGCICCVNDRIIKEPAYDVKTVDTTGAGDSFWGAALYKIISNQKDISSYSEEEIRDLIRFSNAAGSLTTASLGALNAMPSIESILTCMNSVPYLNLP